MILTSAKDFRSGNFISLKHWFLIDDIKVFQSDVEPLNNNLIEAALRLIAENSIPWYYLLSSSKEKLLLNLLSVPIFKTETIEGDEEKRRRRKKERSREGESSSRLFCMDQKYYML
jgi:hypothetical protein